MASIPTVIEVISVIDEAFIVMAETDVDTTVPTDEAVEQLWTALEFGDLRSP
jgi:hypothetical protein